MVEPSRVRALLEPWLTPDDAELVRAVVYRFHATVADSMRSGRIFLAGDAAHQMPPFLGQGLCSGVRDAANLAWKLRLVDDGLAYDALLDTYGDERLPHAAGVVAHAVDTGRLIDELSGRAPASTGLDAAYGGAARSRSCSTGCCTATIPPSVANCRSRLSTGVAWTSCSVATSRSSSTTELFADVRQAWAGLATVVEVPADPLPLTLPPGGAVIVRPDRYVAAVAHDTTELVTARPCSLSSTTPNETRGQTPLICLHHLPEGTTP